MKAHDHAAARRNFLRMMAWAVIPAVVYLAYILQTDGELYMPTRRPWGARTISWEKEPVSFLFGGLQVYGIFLVVMLMLQMFGWIVAMVLGSLWQWARRRWIRWAQWKPWRKWGWWPGKRGEAARHLKVRGSEQDS